MASPDTAAALLTAESLVIAALAVLLQRRDLLMADRGPLKRRFLVMLGTLTGFLIAISFLGSISYLHVAEYPNGFIARQIPPKTIFNTTIVAFVGFVYVGMGVLAALQLSALRDIETM